MRTFRSLRVLSLVGILAIACGSAAPSGGQPAASAAANVPGGTVTIRLSGDWGNPIDGGHTVTTAIGGMVAEAMYDRLVSYETKPSGNVVTPYLAKSWEVKPDSVTFKLRDDVTCSDGTKLTPTAVYNSFVRLNDPNTKSRWPVTLWGSGPYKMSKDDAAGTFTFSLPVPFTNLLFGFSSYFAGVICPKGLEAGVDFTKGSYGSGPFVFESAVQGSEYVVKKRDGWTWGPEGRKTSDSGFPDRIVFKVVPNDTTAANLLLTGGLDIATVAGPDVKRMRADETLEAKIHAGFAPYTLQMNEAPGRPAASETVRKAVYTALDPKAWNQAAYEGQATISTNFQSNPGGYCYTDLTSIMPKPSVPDARKILTDAGYTPTGAGGKLQKDGQVLTIKVVGTNFTGSGVEYIADTLEQVGIKVDLLNTDYNTFAQNFGALNYDLLVGLFGGNAPIASNTANFFRGDPPPKGNNRIVRDDPQLNALVDKAYGAPIGDQSCAAWKELNTYLITKNIALPWVSPYTFWFSKKGVFEYYPLGPTLLPEFLRRLKP